MGLGKKTIDDQNYCGKKVLVRCDFNVPMKDGVITDTKRIVGALPTVKYLVDHNAKVILCSHMGRPHNIFNDVVKLDKKEKKKIDAMPEAEQAEATAKALEAAKGDVKKFSLAPVAAELSKLLGKEVIMGIRPENLHDEELFLQNSPDSIIDADVEVVELMGSETYLYLKTVDSGINFIARVDARSTSRAGDRIKIAIDANRLHFFDVDTEASILNR